MAPPTHWQEFQARCVILFQEDLGDPHCKEYGRSGQDQGGIDIIGLRGARHVGIQCRCITNPEKIDKIRSDVQRALDLPYDFAEIIFATTAPDSTKSSDIARAIENELSAAGKKVRIQIYGWRALQDLIARYDRAWAFFFPDLGAPREQIDTANALVRIEEKLNRLNEAVVPPNSGVVAELDRSGPGQQAEDAALHVRIDAFRDLLSEGQSQIALEHLTALLETVDASKTPYGAFRLYTNIAAALLDLGREHEAATFWTQAFELRSDDSRAIANFGLARLIAGNPYEAMELGKNALSRDRTNAAAVSLLLQAAARSDWNDDPEKLIPSELKGTPEADLGLLEFKRRRHDPSWMDDARTFVQVHDDRYFRHLSALATLERVTGSGVFLPSAIADLAPGELDAAAETLTEEFERKFSQRKVSGDELSGVGNNAAVALRVAGKYARAINVLQRTIERVGEQVSLVRMLATVQAIDGSVSEAISTLARIPADAEAQVISAELLAETDRSGAIEILRQVNPEQLPLRQREARATLWTELALSLNDRSEFLAAREALGLSEVPEEVCKPLLLEAAIRFEKLELSEATRRLALFAQTMHLETPLPARLAIARKLSTWGDHATASDILEGHIDLSHPTEITKFYMQALATARRDEAFESAFVGASDETRADPDILWLAAAHAWNTGDIPRAERFIDALVAVDERNLRGALLKADILVRQDKVSALRKLLEKPLEHYAATRLSDRFHLVQLLVHFGFVGRAADLAYRLLLENRDQSQAWMTLAEVVLARGDAPLDSDVFEMAAAGSNAAVSVLLENGESRFFVIEPDPRLRAMDSDAIEPEHEFAQAVNGLGTGDLFELGGGRLGEIRQIRHKYIARFHDILSRYEERFPTVFGFRSFSINPEAPNGLDEIIEELKQRHQFVTAETRAYVNGPLPLAALAHRVGVDVIDAAYGVREIGYKIKVCRGHELERMEAAQAIRENAAGGCVLDPLTFWTAISINALDSIVAACGTVNMTQRTVDLLRARRTRLLDTRNRGSMSYDNGKIRLTEMSPEFVDGMVREIDRALEWVRHNATLRPVRATDSLPEVVRSFIQTGRSDMLDEVVVCQQTQLLLLTDDGPIRQVAFHAGVRRSAWLQAALLAAGTKGVITQEAYARATAALLERGQSYLSVSANNLVAGLELALENGLEDKGIFRDLASALGGASADPVSHAVVTLEALAAIWNNPRFRKIRGWATGLMLEAVVRERQNDYPSILRSITSFVRQGGALEQYIDHWLTGHFLRV